MKRQLSRFTCCGKCHDANTILNMNRLSSRGRKSSPELFTHNLTLAHMKQSRRMSRLSRSISLLVRCAFVALMGITILSMGNIAYAQETLVTNVDQPYTWYDDHGQKGLDLPGDLEIVIDEYLEAEGEFQAIGTGTGTFGGAIVGGTYGGMGGFAIGAIVGATIGNYSGQLADRQIAPVKKALREFLEDVEDTYDTHTIPYGIWNGTLAQEFTTGSNGYGYDLSSVGIYGRFYPDNAINFPTSISIWSGPYTPVAHLYTLPFAKSVNDGSHGLRLVYQPESPATLEPDTRYVIFVGHVENSRVVVTSSGNEDAGASPGWSIKNDLAEKSGDLWRLVTPEDAGRKVFPADAFPVLRIGIQGSLLDSRSITVSLTDVGEGRFKATATASAPSDIVLPITVINGTINGGATTVTIPAGRTESDLINVSRIPGTTFPVIVNIGNMPNPPAGYALFKTPSRLPLQVLEHLPGGPIPVSARTPQVRDAIVRAAGVNSAEFVTETHLATITGLGVNHPPGTAVSNTPIKFQIGDFSGLPALTTLGMEGHAGIILPDGIFDDLTSLERLSLYNSKFTTIPNAVLGLTSLRILNLGYHRIASIPAGAFDQLTQLETLILDAAAYANTFTSLPDGVFDNLTSLTRLDLAQNKITSLPAGVFDNLTSLKSLNLNRIHSLSSLPAGIFDNLTSLETLSLQGLRPNSLPDGIFNNLTSLTYLSMAYSQLTSLPDGIFSGLSSLTALRLAGNAVDPLPLTVSLEKVADGQFKAVAPTGAPFDIVLPVNARNGSIRGSTTTLTIPKGSVESTSLTVTRTSGTSAAVTADIGTLPGLPADVNQYGTPLHQGYTLVKSDDLPLVVINRLASGITPVSERTSQVREAILNVVRLDYPDISNYADITETHLAGITPLYLNGRNITALKVGDFGGLTSLEELRLYNNQLTTLPEDIFDGLTSLTTLRLYGNQLSTLPEDIFDELIELTTLQLGLNQFTTLPSSIFDGLTKLTDLRMIGNQFATLPDGIFKGLTALTTLYLGDNAATPLPLTVSLEKIGVNQFKATAPTGAPFDLVLPLSIANGTIDNGATTITIPAGGLESDFLTVLRTSDRTATVTVDIGTLPGLPTNHSGYSLVKSGVLLLTFTNLSPVFTPVNERTPQVRDQIVLLTGVRFRDVTSANDVAPAHLRSTTYLDLRNKSITSLKAGDFSGMSSLETLNLNRNSITSLPEDVFDGLSALKELWLQSNELTSLPAGVFNGLSALEKLQLSSNALTGLPEEIFVDLSSLTHIDLYHNSVNSLSANVFKGLSSLTSLRLSTNNLTSLPEDVFGGLSKLETIDLHNNSLASLPGDIFDGVSSLTTLELSSNALTSLPEGVFEGLSNLTSISMHSNSARLLVTVSLERVGAGQFKAVATTGAPFDMVLPLTITNGSISGGATKVTISKGSVESNTLTVTRTSGTTAAVTVDIGTLPRLPSNHSGYGIRKSSNALPLEVISIKTPTNRAPVFTDGTSTIRSIAENTAAGVNIGTPVAATDADNDTLTYTLSGTDANAFNIERTTGQLKTSAPLDYETKSTYTVTVTVSDGSLSDTITVTINVTDINEQQTQQTDVTTYEVGDEIPLPSGFNTPRLTMGPGRSLTADNGTYTCASGDNCIIQNGQVTQGTIEVTTVVANTTPAFTEGASTTRTIAENTATGVNIGTPVAATDAQNDTLTYTLSGTDAASFSINGSTGQLRTKAALDYETKATYTVTITVSDGSLTDSITVTINVTDIAETSPATTAVNIPDPNLRAKIEAALGKASGASISAAEMATLTSLNAQDAGIINLTGLETATNLTELQLWDNTISNISSVAGLTNLTRLYLWGNTISDISAVSGLTNLTRLYLGENAISDISHVAGLTNLTHLRLGKNSISNISAVAGLTNLTELQIGNNAITNISAVAKLTNLVWLDAPNNSISDISAVANLTNLTSLMLTGNTISDISTLTGLTKLIELYLGENSILDLSPLAANRGLGANTEIDVQGNPLSYPSIYTHIPALQARNVYIDFDNRTPTAPTKISGDTQQGAPSTALAQPFVVEVQDGDSATFAGVPVTFAVTAGGGTLSVTSTATNTNGRAESTLILGSSAGTNTVRVSVQGVSQAATFTAEAATTNTAPVFTDGTSTTRTIAENTAAGVNIGTPVAATDADNDTLTYTLGGTDAASFAIDGTTGQLKTQAALDYETKSSYSVTVSVSDGNGGSDGITVTINVTDVDEQQTEQTDVTIYEAGDEIPLPSGFNTPRLTMGPGRSLTADNGTYTCVSEDNCIIQNGQVTQGTIEVTTVAANTAPMFTDGTSTTRSIAENTAAGVSIGTAITATDTNNDILTYTLSGTEASAFSIDSSTGQLQTKSALDYETKRSYTVTITVSDGSLTDTITVTINVTDVAETPVVPTLNLLSDRTPEVRDAIVAAVPGVNSANDVTEAHLAAITRLDLENKNISSLKDGDFDGMTALFELRLQNNRLQTLPANIFSGLSSLRTLYLNNNRLSSLPSTVFSGLSSLSNLYMNNNQITSLPALVFSGLTSLRQINMHTNLLTTLPVNVFSGLSSLTQIYLRNNQLTNLPPELFSGLSSLQYLYLDNNRFRTLPAGMFTGLSSLTQLLLNNNRLTSLPEGVFRGLTASTWLWLQGNTVDPLLLTISLEKVGVNQFKATVPAGAPFTIVLPLRAVNGAISGGANTLTIPQGSVESGLLTVTRTTGTTAAVTVDTGTLPGLPANHQGYQLTKSTNVPVEIISAPGNRAPIFTEGASTTRAVAENTASGVNIGAVIAATDPDNDTLTYTLNGTDAASFSINSSTGQLQTKFALDYETQATYTVTVTVSDGSLTDTITVTVNITDIDELPTNTGVCKVGDILAPGESCTYPGTDATFSVLDNGQAQWNIPDLPPLLQWINQTSISGSLSISTTINGETYHFVAEELSSGSWEIKEIGDSGTQQPDPPEQPQPPVTESDPPTLRASTAAPLTEATLHEGVVTLTLNDGTYEWASSKIRNAVTVSTGITGVTVRSFDIDRVSDTEVIVELTFDGTDFDTNSTLTFTVGAGAIAGYDGAALTAQVPVTASTESVVASTTSPLTEDTLDGSVVTLTLSGRNYESSGVRIRNAVTVSGIDGVTVGTFDIDRVSDTQVTVELTFDGNISTDGTLTFTVGPGAIAGYNGPALTTQVSVTASTETPTPTNTAPTFTAGSTTTRTVAENTVANVNVGSAVAATDANNDTLTYTLGGTDANVFSIESTTGQLKTRAALDYETKRTYTVTITVSDGNGGSDSITVTITVTNVVENRAPVFTDGVSTTRSVTENTAARQNIGRTISATDPNGDTLRYNLSGTEAASFRIDGTTGQLRTWAALDYETKRTYTVTVTVSDGSLTDTITVTINVTDVDDTPTLNVSTAVPLTEATLHGSVVTLTLSKKTYHTNWNFVSQNVEVSGITGVTFRRHNVVRVKRHEGDY